jgi:hypothetical protein
MKASMNPHFKRLVSKLQAGASRLVSDPVRDLDQAITRLEHQLDLADLQRQLGTVGKYLIKRENPVTGVRGRDRAGPSRSAHPRRDDDQAAR